MALFGSSKVPSYDVGALTNIVNQGYNKRKNLLQGAFGELPQFGKQYEDKANTIGQTFGTENLGAAQDYQKGLAGLGEEAKRANELSVASNREQNFRQVPEVERRIRDIVGATIGFGSGAAAPQLAAPTLQAAQQSGDFANQLEVNRLNEVGANRKEGLGAVFNAQQTNALNKMGIDIDTAKMLLETGRGDVLNKALQLSGIEGEKSQSLLDLEQLAQSQNIARAQAKAKSRAAIAGTIGSVAGLGVGALAQNPLLGLGIGSAASNLATGGEGGSIDPLLLAILSRQKAAATPPAK